MNPTGAITYPTELVIVSAENDGALLEAISALVTFIDRIPGASLTDIAYTCSLSKGPSRMAIVASSTMDLRERLASARSRLESGSATRLKDKSGTYFFKEKLLGEGGKLAFVFPGVMSFYPDMMRDLVVEHPECRAPFDELDEALSGETDFTPSNFIFPPARTTDTMPTSSVPERIPRRSYPTTRAARRCRGFSRRPGSNPTGSSDAAAETSPRC